MARNTVPGLAGADSPFPRGYVSMTNRRIPQCSPLRARLYEATGRRLLILGVGVLVYITLVTVGAFFLVIRLIPSLISSGATLSPEAIALISFATLAGIATVVRSMPSLIHAVVKILDARRPETAGLVMQPSAHPAARDQAA
jgi:hypothetical protein